MQFARTAAIAAFLALAPAAPAQTQFLNLTIGHTVVVELIGGVPCLVIWSFDGPIWFTFKRPQPGQLRAYLFPVDLVGFDIGCGGYLKFARSDDELTVSGQPFPGDRWLYHSTISHPLWARYLTFYDEIMNSSTTYTTTFATGTGTSSPCPGHFFPQFHAVVLGVGQY